MRRRAALLGLLVAIVGHSTAYASHSMAGGAECGTRSFDADLVKGRTDSMVVHAEYTIGCKSYTYTNYVGASGGSMAECADPRGNCPERNWQMAECQRVGRLDVARFFEMYFDTEINPADVKVSCTRWAGPD